jgi:hypothetical protein
MTEKADAVQVARRSTLQIETPEIQGNDSWVEVIPFTVGERLSIPATFNRMDMIRERVIGWNWVDGDGEPLPQPGGEVDVIQELTTFELAALTDVVLGFPGLDDLKN